MNVSDKTPEWYKINREYCLQWRRDYYKRNKARHRARTSAYYIKNKKRLCEIAVARNAVRRKTEPTYKLIQNLRILLRQSRGGVGFKINATDLLGCTPRQFVESIESQFKPGMTWANHGANGWHMDHIIPQSAFDLFNPEHVKACFHYSNIQPLWAHENRTKGGINNV